jgi:hypothetical protein
VQPEEPSEEVEVGEDMEAENAACGISPHNIFTCSDEAAGLRRWILPRLRGGIGRRSDPTGGLARTNPIGGFSGGGRVF